MAVPDRHIRELKQRGFTVLPRYFDAATVGRARAAFHSEVAPTYEEWDAAGRPPHTAHTGFTEWPPGSGERRQLSFPWHSWDLNSLCLDPGLTHMCERVIGQKDVRMYAAGASVKYAGGFMGDGPGYGAEDHFHKDQGNNTLGPFRHHAPEGVEVPAPQACPHPLPPHVDTCMT